MKHVVLRPLSFRPTKWWWASIILVIAITGSILLLVSRAAVQLTRVDINKDGKVTVIDLSMLLAKYNTNDPSSDLNEDGKVTVIDLSILLGNYGKSVPKSHYDPTKPYTIIMIGWHNYETQYAQLENSKVNLTYRSIEKTPASNQRDLTLWDATGYKYYNNVAGSDWASSTGNACANIPAAYMDQTYSQELAARSGSLGFYMHEMVSLNAACNGWNWANAVESLQWASLDQYVSQARAQNKKVIWSEPAQGWQAIMASATGRHYMSHWRDVIVPMYATNFNTAGYNWVPTARASAMHAAQTYSTPLGVSVQSWYFRESPDPLTIDSTVTLAEGGFSAGATYYQIEGTWDDMQWPAGKPTTYMQGILDFSKRLETR